MAGFLATALIWAVFGPREAAIAEPATTATAGLYAEWDLDADPPLLLIEGTVDASVTVTYHAMLGNLDHHWDEMDRQLDERGSLRVSVVLPEDAWLDDAAEDYVTDLSVKVRTEDEQVRLPLVHLAWQAGRAAAPTLWDRDQMRTEAPNGVLAAALRGGLEPHVRVLPDVGPNVSNLDPTEAM